ncbi:MAG: lytic transglycosylase domain-containing protein [Anaerolineales bacterium]
MQRTIVIPAVFIGCLIVIWVGTVAAAQMPSQELLVPTENSTAATSLKSQSNASSQWEDEQKNPVVEGSLCALSDNYPSEILQWCDLIESAAYETGLPPNLIAAVMLQESGGDPLIYSSSGAVGLMQVMPRDGLAAEFMCINGPCFASRPTIEELQDPAFNVFYGSRMLAGLYSKHGSYREALYRYGPMDMGYTYADLVLRIWENY